MKTTARNFRMSHSDDKKLRELAKELNCNDTDAIRLLIRIGGQVRFKNSIKRLKKDIEELGASI